MESHEGACDANEAIGDVSSSGDLASEPITPMSIEDKSNNDAMATRMMKDMIAIVRIGIGKLMGEKSSDWSFVSKIGEVGHWPIESTYESEYRSVARWMGN